MKLVTEIKIDLSKLRNIRAACSPRAEAIIEKHARNIERRAKDTIEAKHIVDTGNLKSGVHITPAGQFSRIISDACDYGIYHEYGTYKMAARPWLTPSVETERAPFLADWGDLLK